MNTTNEKQDKPMTNTINLVTNVNEIPGTLLDKKQDKHDTFGDKQVKHGDDRKPGKQGTLDNSMTNKTTLMTSRINLTTNKINLMTDRIKLTTTKTKLAEKSNLIKARQL